MVDTGFDVVPLIRVLHGAHLYFSKNFLTGSNSATTNPANPTRCKAESIVFPFSILITAPYMQVITPTTSIAHHAHLSALRQPANKIKSAATFCVIAITIICQACETDTRSASG